MEAAGEPEFFAGNEREEADCSRRHAGYAATTSRTRSASVCTVTPGARARGTNFMNEFPEVAL
jgi:hypothetical protein